MLPGFQQIGTTEEAMQWTGGRRSAVCLGVCWGVCGPQQEQQEEEEEEPAAGLRGRWARGAREPGPAATVPSDRVVGCTPPPPESHP